MPTSKSTTAPVTALLAAWQGGDQSALNELMPLVMAELKRLAGAHLARESSHRTLQTTGLVHEAYLRLVAVEPRQGTGRAQFFALAASIMRHILVDHARARQGPRRGGGLQRVEFDEALGVGTPAAGITDLDDALRRLEQTDARKARLAEMRLFAGMTNEEAAELLGLSLRTVVREWSFVKAWLSTELDLAASGQ